MFVCRNLRDVWSVFEGSHVNLRLITTAAKTSTVKTQQQKQHKGSKPHKNKVPIIRNISKRERKLLRQRLLMTSEGTSKKHIYLNLYPWKTPRELAEHLKSAEVYNKDGLIALNKPYGIAMTSLDKSESSQTQTLINILNSSSAPDDLPAMNQVLPILKQHYHANHLEIIKSTERWSSGLMLLSTSSKITEKVEKCFRRSKAMSDPAMTYTGITLGIPRPITGDTKVGITLEYVPSIGKVPVISEKYSINSAKSGKVKPVTVRHRAIHYNKEADVSLFEIQTQVMKWHFLRVWSAYCYCPILGDHLYSARVRTLVGNKVLISPQNVTCEPQKLPEDLYSRLNLQVKSSELIPCHLHLSNLSLSQYNKDESPLVLSCPPPEHFTWTCEHLGLVMEEGEELKNNNGSSSSSNSSGGGESV